MAVAAESPVAQPSPRRRSEPSALRSLGRVLVPLAVVAALAYGGWRGAQYFGLISSETAVSHLTHRVTRGDLLITVTEDGNLESASNIDIRCQVAGGAAIKEIVADGTVVKQDDQLVELDSAAIDEQILTQRIQYEKARAVRDQAVNDLAAAKIALREYVEGTFVKELQTAESQITIAQENLRSAQNTLDYTERMFRKGYVTPLQKEAQEFAVKKAQLDKDLAETAKKVLREFTFEKMKNELETKVATAEAKAKSEEAAFQLEDSKLKRLETQKVNCIIKAPQAGMVVYANESSSRFGGSSDRPKIEEGATVREGQVILRVPDLKQMQVKVTVHESKVENVRIGMPAQIRIQDRRLTGYVTSMANQPESNTFSMSGVKKYAVIVRVDGEQSDLKPGMTAEVRILINDLKQVLTVPVQCVVELSGKFYCWKTTGSDDGIKTEVTLGPGNDKLVEIRSGLAEGDLVLQNPPERPTSSSALSSDARGQFGPDRRNGGGAPDPAGGPAGTGAGPGGGGPGLGAPGGGGAGRSGRGLGNIMALDKDGDKRISRNEAPEQMQMFFEKIDADGDGFIVEAEAQAAAARMRGPGGSPGGAQP